MGKVDQDVARLALEQARSASGPIAFPAGTRVPAGIRTWTEGGALYARSHDIEAWIRRVSQQSKGRGT